MGIKKQTKTPLELKKAVFLFMEAINKTLLSATD
jgi:hypothetical protein